jgi:YD repeat-containing protein
MKTSTYNRLSSTAYIQSATAYAYAYAFTYDAAGNLREQTLRAAGGYLPRSSPTSTPTWGFVKGLSSDLGFTYLKDTSLSSPAASSAPTARSNAPSNAEMKQSRGSPPAHTVGRRRPPKQITSNQLRKILSLAGGATTRGRVATESQRS